MEHIQALFEEAIALEGDARAAFLSRLDDADHAAYIELSALLAADEHNTRFTGDLGIQGLVGIPAGSGSTNAEASDSWHPSTAAAPNLEGRTVGPYRIEQCIGRGGMGVVYKARDTRLDRYVALKFLIGAHGASATAQQRFLAEARAVSRLDHSNICTLFDIGETDDGHFYIAMAFYDGAPLDRYVRDTPVSLREVVDWTRQIAEGLHCAHTSGVVHRDLKAANVLIMEGRQVKILDFGVAKLQGHKLTDTGLRIGTVAYMSPEQLVGGPVDHRTDIWSLGVLLYQLLLGEHPFPGESSSVVASQILRASVVPPSVRLSWLPQLVDRIVERCLARDVHARYRDLAELLADIANLTNVLNADSRLGAQPVGQGRDSGERDRSDLTHISGLEARQITAVSCSIEPLADQPATSRPVAAELSLGLRRRCETYALSEGIAYVHSIDNLITLCFGYPRSLEDGAVRAVRAATALRRLLQDEIERARGIDRNRWALRFGIHTGDVIVDGSSATTTGLIQHLQGDAHLIASRLQRLAGPDDIVLSRSTANLLKGAFELESVGELSDPGGAERIGAQRLVHDWADGPHHREFWWHADHSLHGRRSECTILEEAWESVTEGEGRVVALKGEAGIGKSRLMQRAVEQFRGECPDPVVLLCTTLHQNTFLYPVKQWLRTELVRRGQAHESLSRSGLSAYLSAAGVTGKRAFYRLADLLDLPPDGSEPPDPSPPVPEMLRDQTIQVLVDIIAQRASRCPQLMLVEDLHWADSATIELCQRIVDQGTYTPVLLLLSFRPEFTVDWLNRAHLIQLSLGKLGTRHSLALARERLHAHDLPDELIERIVERSDGVPLFIEELCSSVHDSLEASSNTPVADGEQAQARPFSIPETLKDSLVARLDRNIEFKPIVQLGAVIGRTFDYEMIRRVWTGDPVTLDAGLEYFVGTELLYQSGAIPEARFVFKHALVQDAAYGSLVSTTRATYHRLVADAIECHFPEQAEREPEMLAAHRSEAQDPARSAPLWLAAAKHALRRSALTDAITLAVRGLEEVARLPKTPETLGLELELLMTRGPALMAHYSWSKPDVQRTYERARVICEGLGNPPDLFPVLYGLYTYHCVVGHHEQGRQLSSACLAVANSTTDDGLWLEARMLRGMTHFFQGELGPAREWLEQASEAYTPERFGDHCYLYGQDPGMVTNSYLALTLAMTGDTERARALSARSLDTTRGLDHPFSLSYGLCFAAWLALLLEDTEQGYALAEEAQALSREHGTAIMLGMSRVLIGWARIQQGDSEQALLHIRDGIGQFQSLGAGVLMPYWHVLLALAELIEDDPRAALRSLDRGVAIAAETSERWSAAELERLRARALAECGQQHTARDRLDVAIALARQQSAALFEQRALSDLARLI